MVGWFFPTFQWFLLGLERWLIREEHKVLFQGLQASKRGSQSVATAPWDLLYLATAPTDVHTQVHISIQTHIHIIKTLTPGFRTSLSLLLTFSQIILQSLVSGSHFSKFQHHYYVDWGTQDNLCGRFSRGIYDIQKWLY